MRLKLRVGNCFSKLLSKPPFSGTFLIFFIYLFPWFLPCEVGFFFHSFFSQYCFNLIIINIINYLNLISITSSSGIALSSWSWASTSNNNRNIDIQLPVRRWGASSLGEGPFFLGWRWPWMALQGRLALRELGTVAWMDRGKSPMCHRPWASSRRGAAA